MAIFGIMAAAFNNDLGRAAPWFIVFLVSLPLIAAGAWLLRLGSKRAGTLPLASVASEQRAALLRAGSVIVLGSVLGFDGFVYLAFALQGSRRLAFALAALIAGTAISECGVRKIHKVLGRPGPSLLGWSPKRSWAISVALLLIEGGLLLIGFLRPDLLPIQ